MGCMSVYMVDYRITLLEAAWKLNMHDKNAG